MGQTSSASLKYADPTPCLPFPPQVCILAREAGMMVEMEGIPVESLVPEPLRALKGGEEYMARLPEFDKDMEVRRGTGNH